METNECLNCSRLQAENHSLRAELEKVRKDHAVVCDGIHLTVLRAIAVLNKGWWGTKDSQELADALKCRGILRTIVPHDWDTCADLPIDENKMRDAAKGGAV